MGAGGSDGGGTAAMGGLAEAWQYEIEGELLVSSKGMYGSGQVMG
jgi:hypothetical protein